MIPGMVTNVPLPQDTMLYQFDAVESQASMSPQPAGFGLWGLTIIKQQAPLHGLSHPHARHQLLCHGPGVLDIRQTLSFSVRRCGNGDQYDRYITPSTTANLAESMWTNSFILNQGNTYQDQQQ